LPEGGSREHPIHAAVSANILSFMRPTAAAFTTRTRRISGSPRQIHGQGKRIRGLLDAQKKSSFLAHVG
ncbi:hypothetical protein, partial [Paenibacillus pasadenensis]|uniref:hypothetical protein n=1 Tax=Paenibacillus pasadenensis TaxID=217090 RepID=UPI001C3FDFE1